MSPAKTLHRLYISLSALLTLVFIMSASAAPGVAKTPVAELRLLGVINASAMNRALVSVPDGAGGEVEEFVSKGDLVAGYTLWSVESDRVELRRGRERTILTVRGERLSPKGEVASAFELPAMDLRGRVAESVQLAMVELAVAPKGESAEVKTIRREDDRKVKVNASPTFIRPMREGYVSSTFGLRLRPTARSGMKGSLNHTGVDIAADHGTTVYASAAGTVTESGSDMYRGRYIVIRHAGGYETRYYHLYKRFVSAGKVVRQGEAVGQEGNTGVSTGPHLHFEIRRNGVALNPAQLIPSLRK
jgi:murein DD-endopeptidase MepM/ murein hydrolase activator NlpD